MGMPLWSQQASSRDAAIWPPPIDPVQQRRPPESRPEYTTRPAATSLAAEQTVWHDGSLNAPWLIWPTGRYPGPGPITRVEDWPIVDPELYRAYHASPEPQEAELPPPLEGESRLEERYPEHMDSTSFSPGGRFIIYPESYFVSQRPLPPHLMAQEQYNTSRTRDVEPGTAPRGVVLGPFQPGSTGPGLDQHPVRLS